jgi:hypothetical protein
MDQLIARLQNELLHDPVQSQPWQLVVLREAVHNEGVTMIPLTTWAMLHAPFLLADETVAIVIDGKMRVLSNDWLIVTIGWLCLSQGKTRTNLRRDPSDSTVRLQSMEHVTNFMPFIFAIVPSENNASMDALWRVTEKYWPKRRAQELSLSLRVVQWHNDYARAFAHMRRTYTPLARFLGDFSHFTRQLDVYARHRWMQPLVRKHVVPLIYATRTIPTYELFSALWSHQLQFLQRRNWLHLHHWLTQTYFKVHAVDELRLMGFSTLHPTTVTELTVGVWHAGVLTVKPGTLAGSQTVEALHSGWESLKGSRTVPTDPWKTILNLKKLTKRTGERTAMEADGPRSTRTIAVDERLLADDGLACQCESSSRDLWRWRNEGNHIIVTSDAYANTAYVIFHSDRPMAVISPALDATAEEKPSTRKRKGAATPRAKREFGSRRKRRQQTTGAAPMTSFQRHRLIMDADHPPASRAVHAADATNLVRLMEGTEHTLVEALRSLDILPGTSMEPINVPQLVKVLSNYEIVIVGSLAQSHHRDPTLNLLCTCHRFSLRGCVCQHTVFVEALDIQDVRMHTRTFSFFDRS